MCLSVSHQRHPIGAVLCTLALVACARDQRSSPQPRPESWVIESPSRSVTVEVRRAFVPSSRTAILQYKVERAVRGGRELVLDWSPLGIARTDHEFVEDLRLLAEGQRPIVEDYQLLHGKQRRCHNEGVEKTLSLATSAGARLDLVFRVFDDGFAFRYQFPDRSATPVSIVQEHTGFRLPAGGLATLMQHDNPGRPDVNYENVWQVDIPIDTPAPTASGWSFPALFANAARDSFALITESGLDGRYPGTHLQASRAGVYHIAFPSPAEAQGLGDALPNAVLPWSTPWRVGIVGDLATIVRSTLVTDVAAPAVVPDTTFVQPGRASWEWWSSQGGRALANLLPFVDLAAEMGWEYTLVDAGWHAMPDGPIESLLAHARRKNVGTWLWYNSGGPLNTQRAAPRDRMWDPDVRKVEMKRLSALGVKGIKVDFFDSDKQDVIKLYLDILKDAANARLMVNFHGSTLPRGWNRTHPHMMGMESVRGAENYRVSQSFADRAAWHNTIQPFTRNTVGPMDYTPVTLSQIKKRRSTTDAHELALAVLFENGVQHFADTPAAYRGLPEPAQAILRTVPSAWDETRLLGGYPGDWVMLARRRGRDVYVAAINGRAERRTVDLPLEFLGQGAFAMSLVGDGQGDVRFTIEKGETRATDSLTLVMAPRGGFVVRFAGR